MSELARTYLRQARSFLIQGDAARAADLLERAAVLVRGDASLTRQITWELAGVYDRLGRKDDARRLHARLERMNPAPAQPPSAPDAVSPMAPPARRTKRLGVREAVAGAVAAALILGAAVWFWRGRSGLALAPVVPTASANVARPDPATSASVTTSDPATRASVTRSDPPAPAVVPATLPSTAPAPSREARLKENVAMVLVVLRYAGPAGGQQEDWRIPLASGTAFVVSRDGILLTNRHVVEPPEDKLFPTSLDELGKPTVTLRGKQILVCFSRNSADRLEAQVLSRSDTHDLAVLKVNRTFADPLKLSFALPHQGDDVVACGFPGVANDAPNQANQTPEVIRNYLLKYVGAGHIDLVDIFSADSFRSTLTRGVVSQPERNISGVSYMQLDAVVPEGHSGGPVLNGADEVIGVTTSRIPVTRGNCSFALRLDQLRSELQAQGVMP